MGYKKMNSNIVVRKNICAIDEMDYVGRYFGEYTISYSAYRGIDFSKICFVFSGQGSAYPGMFEHEYNSLPIVKQQFDSADALAEKHTIPHLSTYLLHTHTCEGKELIVVRNLSLFTIQVALCKYLIEQRLYPTMLTGFSVGEFPALVAAGIVSFEDMFDILYHRDMFCPDDRELGTMIAIKAQPDEIHRMMEGYDYYVSNLCSSQQTVISVPEHTLHTIIARLEEQNVVFKELTNVPQPYHSPLLEPMAKKLEQYIQEKSFVFTKPHIPVFSSVTQQLINEETFACADVIHILSSQLIAPVNFIYQISEIYKLHCFSFIEIGTGETCSKFIDTILEHEERKLLSLKTYLPDAHKVSSSVTIDPKNNKFFALIARSISKLTGYTIEKISIDDNFQEDLGVDSIKKANILFNVIEEAHIPMSNNYNLSEIRTIHDAVELLENPQKYVYQKQEEEKIESHFDRFIMSWQPEPLPRVLQNYSVKHTTLAVTLTGIMNDTDTVYTTVCQFLNSCKGCSGTLIIVAGEKDFTASTFPKKRFKENIFELIEVINFFRAVFQDDNALSHIQSLRIVLMTTDNSHPFAIALGAFFKALKKEIYPLYVKHIRVEHDMEEKDCIVLAEYELLDARQPDVAYINAVRHVPSLKQLDEAGAPCLSHDSVLIALGGAKGITFSLMKHLSQTYQPHLYLVGRSPENDPAVAANIHVLSEHNPHIQYVSMDAKDYEALALLCKRIYETHHHIDMIINGVGIEISAFLSQKTTNDIVAELHSKLIPMFNILQLSFTYPMGKIINFSSVVSRYGNPGQTVYSCANEIMNLSVAEYNKDVGKVKAVAIDWPPWDSVGMTANPGILSYMKRVGLSLLDEKRASELFAAELGEPTHDIIEYFDTNDVYAYSFALKDAHRFSPLLGTFNPDNYFDKTFSLETDPYLLDHRIDGISYVPAAVGISMFACLASLYSSSFTCVTDFTIHSPIMIRDTMLRVILRPQRRDQNLVCTIQSSAPHFTCSVLTENIPVAPASTIDLSAFTHTILSTSIYSEKALFHGPVFQTMHQALANDSNEICVVIDNDQLLPVHIPSCPITYYDRLIQWIDTAFQSLGLTALLQQNVMAIPIAVTMIRLFSDHEVTKHITIVPSNIRLDSETITGDVLIMNEKKDVLVALNDITLKAIRTIHETTVQITRN